MSKKQKVGAPRKPQKKVRISTTIDAATMADLRSMQSESESLGQLIDRLVAQRKVAQRRSITIK